MPEHNSYAQKLIFRFNTKNIAHITFKKTAISLASTLTLSLSIAGTAYASQTLKYTYDALGRVTFVEDSSNGNRDYDYDAAGNRTLVVVGNNSDEDSDGGSGSGPVALIAPTSLSVGGPYSTSGGYICYWAAVPGATQYEVGLADGSVLITVDTFDNSPGPRPSWVRAINDDEQGPKAFF